MQHVILPVLKSEFRLLSKGLKSKVKDIRDD